MMLMSAPVFAAETPLLVKVTKITGCEAWVRAEPLADRGPILTQLKNLASRITLLAQIVSEKQFGSLTGSAADELDEKLAQIAENLLDTNPNALKAEDLKDQLDALEGRILDNLTSEQKKIVTVADVKSSVPPSEVNEPGGTNQYSRPAGLRQYGPGQAKP